MNRAKLAAYGEILFEPVKGFERLKPAEFEVKFAEDVADLTEELCATDWRCIPGLGEILVLSNGYAVFVDRTNRYSLFETEAHHAERKLKSEWASFVRGTWTDRCPTEPGMYFVRDRDLGRRSLREIRRVNGRLIDVSGGNVPWGQVSVWAGQWWVPSIPALPGAY